MDLTPKLKAEIDGKTLTELLRRWRFSASGDPMFEGQSGEYWAGRMRELRERDPSEYVAASKYIGWG